MLLNFKVSERKKLLYTVLKINESTLQCFEYEKDAYSKKRDITEFIDFTAWRYLIVSSKTGFSTVENFSAKRASKSGYSSPSNGFLALYSKVLLFLLTGKEQLFF